MTLAVPSGEKGGLAETKGIRCSSPDLVSQKLPPEGQRNYVLASQINKRFIPTYDFTT